jgi:protein translocase SecG subunit
MDKILGTIQIIISVLLIISILLQNRGAGLSETFGGGAGGGNVYQTKRGFDKFLFAATIILAVLFLGTAFYSFLQK